MDCHLAELLGMLNIYNSWLVQGTGIIVAAKHEQHIRLRNPFAQLSGFKSPPIGRTFDFLAMVP